MKSGTIRFLRRSGKRFASLRGALPGVDRLANWWLESQFLALAGRPSGALSEARCRGEHEDARRYRALVHRLRQRTPRFARAKLSGFASCAFRERYQTVSFF